MDTSDVSAAVRNLTDYTVRYKTLMQELAAQWDVHLIGGSHPTLHKDGRLLNTTYYFSPSGEIHEQDKVHRTRWEREKWNTDAGDQLKLFDTPFGKIAILICYDIEFPERSRMVCEAGADILFVPSCTDDRQSFLRVRCCCHARAIENQVFAVHTSTVGNPPVEGLGACRTWGVDSENRPQRGQFLPDLQPHSPAMGQEDGEEWTAAVDSQPTLPKPDRLLAQVCQLSPRFPVASAASPHGCLMSFLK